MGSLANAIQTSESENAQNTATVIPFPWVELSQDIQVNTSTQVIDIISTSPEFVIIDLPNLNLGDDFYDEIENNLHEYLLKLISTPYFSTRYFETLDEDSLSFEFDWLIIKFKNKDQKNRFTQICMWDLIDEFHADIRAELQTCKDLLWRIISWESNVDFRAIVLKKWLSKAPEYLKLLSAYNKIISSHDWLKDKFNLLIADTKTLELTINKIFEFKNL